MNGNKNHIKAYYRMVKTTEIIDGRPTAMYGIEGFGGGESVSVTALSRDKQRIKRLVVGLNEGQPELHLLKEAIDGFLLECYGWKTPKGQ